MTTKSGDRVRVGIDPEDRRPDAERHHRADQRHEEPDERVPGGHGGRRSAPAGSSGRARRRAGIGVSPSALRVGREALERAHRLDARRRLARRAGPAPRGSPRRARPRCRCRPCRRRAAASRGLDAGELERRARTPPGRAWPRPTTADDTAPSSSSPSPARSQPLRQRAVPVARHHQRAARARAAPPARARRRGRARTRARRASPAARPRARSARRRRRAPRASRAAQSSRSASRPAGSPPRMWLREVVGDLGGEAALGRLQPDVDARTRARARRAGAAPGGSSAHQRPERVEQHRPLASRDEVPARELGHEQPEARPPSRRRPASWRARSSHTSASHMKIGNSTTRKRGSDISGCGPTG